MKNYAFIRLLLIALLFVSLSGFVSAYRYGDEYSNTYYEKSSYGYDGHQYVKREVQKDPWGEKTVYVKVKDYNKYPSYSYSNRANDYWMDGPYQSRYLGYNWDDSYRRDGYYGSQYHDYYYQPKYYYDGVYYNWHDKKNYYTNTNCNTVRYCNW